MSLLGHLILAEIVSPKTRDKYIYAFSGALRGVIFRHNRANKAPTIDVLAALQPHFAQ